MTGWLLVLLVLLSDWLAHRSCCCWCCCRVGARLAGCLLLLGGWMLVLQE
jgi:hypothetical protein